MMTRIEEAQQIINKSADALKTLKIDEFSFSRIVDLILACEGKIITTGMGKAGIAMRKFSSLLCSLGFPSCYLHPGEASHGDLGLLSSNDILFVASTSGKTKEILNIIDLARNIDVHEIIGITSHVDSPIREKVDTVLDMGKIEEAGHLGMAPTTSILVMLVLTDCLALTCAKENSLSTEEYSRFHHSGYLGGRARDDEKIY